MTFVGFGGLGTTFTAFLLVTDSNKQPVEPDAAPTWQCYAAEGVLPAVNGTSSLAHIKNVTGATGNGVSPIVLTSPNHGITTGTRVRVRNVGGNTNANNIWVATKIDANQLSLAGSTGNGAYTTGGTVEVVGFYSSPVILDGGAGFESDKNFFVRWSWAVGSAPRSQLQSLTVT